MFELIDSRFGGLDILVNNAGIAETKGTDFASIQAKAPARMGEMLGDDGIKTHWDITMEMADEDWLEMIAVHLNGTFFCMREALKLMSRKNAGSIINLSSVAGLMGLEIAPHYGAAKAGILGLTRSVAREVGSRGIRVNAICPGLIDTPMTEPLGPMARKMVLSQTPLGRSGEPREVATVALFLASDDSSFMTGQWVSPNGGIVTI
jgi:3-oxoacyl-[acyl-carrier protein] reductase